MTTQTNVRIVEATPEHAPFIAWVMLTAARSHIERGMWDLLTGASEADTLRILETLASSGGPHWAHHSIFIVAEVDGRPAAALSGYLERECPPSTMLQPLDAAFRAHGRSADDLIAGWQRAASIATVGPEHAPDIWVVEHVATLPEYRRQGLTNALLGAIIERGRGRGATTADIGVLIGNDRAQRAYEKAGFAVIGEKLDDAFAVAYGGCPGIRALRRVI